MERNGRREAAGGRRQVAACKAAARGPAVVSPTILHSGLAIGNAGSGRCPRDRAGGLTSVDRDLRKFLPSGLRGASATASTCLRRCRAVVRARGAAAGIELGRTPVNSGASPAQGRIGVACMLDGPLALVAALEGLLRACWPRLPPRCTAVHCAAPPPHFDICPTHMLQCSLHTGG